jgi:transposase
MTDHVHAFAYFGGVPHSVVYDNDRCLVAEILPDENPDEYGNQH